MANRNASERSYQYNRDYNRDYDYYDDDRGYYGNPGYGFNYYGYGSSPYGYDIYYGEFTGYGPSGYTRSDDRIKDDINDRLTWDGQIDATDINVDVNDGMVTLTGSVDTRRDKRRAEDIADRIPGVWDVSNQLRVRNRRGGHSGQQSRNGVSTGMDVVGSDGKAVGTVKEVRDNDFLVDRPVAFDVYVPFSACNAANGLVQLNVPARDVDKQGWEMPEKMPAKGNR